MDRIAEPELMDLPHEAQAYAAADFSIVNKAFVDRVIEIAGDRQTCRVIDLGCGPGEIARRLAEQRPGWTIVGIDGSTAMLDIARASQARSDAQVPIAFLQGDATATGLPGGSFDVVLSNSLLHHVRDPLALWREMSRLVKPAGVLLLRDLRRPASREAAMAIVDEYAADESAVLRDEFFRSLLAAYTVEEIRGQLATLGLAYRVAEIGDRHMEVAG